MPKADQPIPISDSQRYLKNSFIFVVLSLSSAFFNYLYYPVIAQFLSPSLFGATQALVAIILQVGAIFAGLNLVTIYLVNHLNKDDSQRAIETLQKFTITIFVLVSLVVALCAGSIARFLHISEQWYLLIVSIDLLTSIPFIVTFGYLQAQKRFLSAGLLQLSTVILKLILGTLGTIYFGAAGALAGIALGQVFGMLLYWIVAKVKGITPWDHSIVRGLRAPKRAELTALRPIWLSIASIFGVNVILALYISFDIIAARHYFPPEVSGLYSGASTISNAIVFVCAPLIGVLLPHLRKESLRASINPLLRTLTMVLVVITGSVLFFYLFPKPLLALFGESYIVLAPLLWKLGVLMGLVALITLTLQVAAFYRPPLALLVCIAGACGLIYTVTMHHQTLTSFISAIMAIFATILVVATVLVAWIYHHEARETS